jgi:hypothetical protein
VRREYLTVSTQRNYLYGYWVGPTNAADDAPVDGCLPGEDQGLERAKALLEAMRALNRPARP